MVIVMRRTGHSISSYVKGSIFLSQLRYVGEEKLAETIKRYYNDFKFKHPTPMTLNEAQNVFLELIYWYFGRLTQTVNTIDYGIKKR
jgi:hypothetical protein